MNGFQRPTHCFCKFDFDISISMPWTVFDFDFSFFTQLSSVWSHDPGRIYARVSCRWNGQVDHWLEFARDMFVMPLCIRGTSCMWKTSSSQKNWHENDLFPTFEIDTKTIYFPRLKLTRKRFISHVWNSKLHDVVLMLGWLNDWVESILKCFENSG